MIINGYGVTFHYFHDKKQVQGSLSSKQFDKIIRYLKDDVLEPIDWLVKLRGYCLTFDDGLVDQYKIAFPILKKYNLTAFWFINSAPLVGEVIPLEVSRYFRNTYFKSLDEFYEEFFNIAPKVDIPDDYLKEFPFYSLNDRKFRYIRDKILKEKYNDLLFKLMEYKNININDITKELWINKDNLLELKDNGNVIGLHSHSHPTNLKDLSKKDQYKEYKMNLRILTDILEKKPIVMAHPCNSYSNITLDILNKLNIMFGFISNDTQIHTTHLELPRKDCMLLDVIKE